MATPPLMKCSSAVFSSWQTRVSVIGWSRSAGNRSARYALARLTWVEHYSAKTSISSEPTWAVVHSPVQAPQWSYVNVDALSTDLAAPRADGEASALTQREREVMQLVVAGKLNKQIADELDISMKTVEAHRARVMEKMGVRTLAELVKAAMTVN